MKVLRLSLLFFGLTIVIAVAGNVSPLAVLAQTIKSADINKDNYINHKDMRLILKRWLGQGPCGDGYDCDIYYDGTVNLIDSSLVYSKWTGNQPLTPTVSGAPSATPTNPPIPTVTPKPGTDKVHYSVAFLQPGNDPNLSYVRDIGFDHCVLFAGGWESVSAVNSALAPHADAGCKQIELWGNLAGSAKLMFNNPLTQSQKNYLASLQTWCDSRSDVESCQVVFMHEPKHWGYEREIPPKEQQDIYRMLKSGYPRLDFFSYIQIFNDYWCGQSVKCDPSREFCSGSCWSPYHMTDMCDVCNIFAYAIPGDSGISITTIKNRYGTDKNVADAIKNSDGRTPKMSMFSQSVLYGEPSYTPHYEKWKWMTCQIASLEPSVLEVGGINTGYADETLRHAELRTFIKNMIANRSATCAPYLAMPNPPSN